MTVYKDVYWLVENYIFKRHSQPEMAQMADTSARTISYWLDKHDIKPRWKDVEWLKRQYVNKKQDKNTIARRCRCSPSTIDHALQKTDISIRGRSEYMLSNTSISMIVDVDGYERFKSSVRGDEKSVAVHQLVIIAEGADPEKVFSGGQYHVHHKSGHTRDNRPENLELLEREEHIEKHL